MDIREKLREKGATDAQINAAVVDILEDILGEESGFVQEGGFEAAKKTAQTLMNAQSRLSDLASTYKSEIEELQDRYQKYYEMLQVANKGIDQLVIRDDKTLEAIRAYKEILTATKDVFGEDHLTPECIQAACEAGSYIAWRSIMGSKFDETEKNTKDRRF